MDPTPTPTHAPGRPGRMHDVASRIIEQARSAPSPTARPDAPVGPPTLSVLVPVYNEAATLDALLDRLLALDLGFPFEVVAVDDASSDGSAAVLDRRDDPRLRVLRHGMNRGKGASVQTALDAATGEIVVVQDADLEYDPGQLARLVAPVLAGETDVVYGSRFMGRARDMRLANRLANKGLTLMTRLLYATPITDMETCYKVVRRDVRQLRSGP